jgi:hypothetical protein
MCQIEFLEKQELCVLVPPLKLDIWFLIFLIVWPFSTSELIPANLTLTYPFHLRLGLLGPIILGLNCESNQLQYFYLQPSEKRKRKGTFILKWEEN